MQKSNKLTLFYVLCSVLLFVALFGGGLYGIYLSVGINFMRTNVAQPADVEAGVSNVSYAATANFQPSMTGIIILSVVLVLISIAYFVSLIKQIIFFKQFKIIRESGIEKFIEGKVKSKGSVVVFAFIINVLAFFAGVAGIFVNIKSFMDGGLSWLLYVIDGLVVILSIASIVLLIKKLQERKKMKEEFEKQSSSERVVRSRVKISEAQLLGEDAKNEIDSIEYILLKLKSLRDGKIISDEEHEHLRQKLTGLGKKKKVKAKKEEIAK